MNKALYPLTFICFTVIDQNNHVHGNLSYLRGHSRRYESNLDDLDEKIFQFLQTSFKNSSKTNSKQIVHNDLELDHAIKQTDCDFERLIELNLIPKSLSPEKDTVDAFNSVNHSHHPKQSELLLRFFRIVHPETPAKMQLAQNRLNNFTGVLLYIEKDEIIELHKSIIPFPDLTKMKAGT